MCGICGIFNYRGREPVQEGLLREMCHVLRHRGPDDEGYHLDGDLGLGHRRLSIIDLRYGHQPIYNEDGRVCIVFNGEIYNFRELRSDLEAQGHGFRTFTDTEVILHLYEAYGVGCVQWLNGMFAFAIWDERRQELLLARDRIGIKPLVYTEVGDGKLIFASEMKALLRHPEVTREIDLGALDKFLKYQYIPAPHTIFKGIYKLQPGHLLACSRSKGVRVEQYWDFDFRDKRNGSEASCAEALYELLQASVDRHMISDVPLGAFLSGGIDSSAVVGLMAEVSDRPVKTFSIGFEEDTFSELPYARKIAERFHTEHHEFVVRPNALDVVNEVVAYLDEPFADVSVIPTFLVSQLAREHVTVILSGDGGDELLAGYDWYLADKLDRLYRMAPRVLRDGIVAPAVGRIPITPEKKGLINVLKRFVEGARLPPERGGVRWVTFFNDEERDALLTEDVKADLRSCGYEDEAVAYRRDAPSDNGLERNLYVDSKLYLPDDILIKVDLMSMAHSLEARVPFLDRDFVAFTEGLPGGLKLKALTSKYILKRSMSGLLPEETLRRGKYGFSIPLKNWLRNELKEFVLETLSERKIREIGIFNYPFVDRTVQEHLAGRRDNSRRIWALLVFELWYRRFWG